jgi:transcriptional regulator with XRE-family HTH domain
MMSWKQDGEELRFEVDRADQLGAAVAEFRALRGLSQGQLAERCALHRTYLSKVESGETPQFIERLFALFDELGLRVVVTER